MRVKKIAALLCALLLASLTAVACAEGFYEEMPLALRATQKTQTEKPGKNIVIQRMFPQTS